MSSANMATNKTEILQIFPIPFFHASSPDAAAIKREGVPYMTVTEKKDTNRIFDLTGLTKHCNARAERKKKNGIEENLCSSLVTYQSTN